MSEAQRVIKYLAIAFAIFLSVNIIGGIITAIFFGLSIFGITLGLQDTKIQNNKVVASEEIAIIQDYQDIENLKIEIGYSKLTMKEGNELKVEATNSSKTLETRKSNKTLTIKDNKIWDIFNQNEQTEIIVTVPQNILFEKVKIDAGSRRIKYFRFTNKKLRL